MSRASAAPEYLPVFHCTPMQNTNMNCAGGGLASARPTSVCPDYPTRQRPNPPAGQIPSQRTPDAL